ncbi:MAG: SDR family NAD(P)-dependent oxidoreductase [Anaeromyxobacteraceae bacterium]
MGQDLSGKIIVVTGGSSGVGAAAARAFRGLGATVVITGRSRATAALAAEIGAEAFGVDFGRLASVRTFAGELLARHPRVDVLVNNVGGIVEERRLTEDGHEQTFQVNHLAGFLLTALLRKRLEACRALVVNTSSMAHHWGKVDLGDLENATAYSPMAAYGAAKRMNILHAMELGRRYPGVTGVSFHPGVVASGFAREGSALMRWFYGSLLTKPFLRTPEQGADTLVWLATATPGRALEAGGFYVNRRPGRVNGQVTPTLAGLLWDASERLLGLAPAKAA